MRNLFLVAPLMLMALLFAGTAQPTRPPALGPAPALSPPSSDKPPVRPLVIGFSQVGAESNWRNANTASVMDEAKKRGYQVNFASANGNTDKQIADVRGFIAQRVDILVIAPLVASGWEGVLQEAKAASIPVIFEDRKAEVPPELYAGFIGADFRAEGRKAAEWLAQRTGGKAVILQIEGQAGSAPNTLRVEGFAEAIKQYPDMKIIGSQSGEFRRAGGLEVMQAALRNPDLKDLSAVFALNDDMALGAIAAIQQGGKVPGKDILIVSIDGIKEAVKAMADGTLNCTVECNPNLGPQILDAIDLLLKKHVASHEEVLDESRAKELLPTRNY